MMNFSEKELEALLSVAKESVLRSGAYLRKAGPGGRSVRGNQRRDVKISADMKSESVIAAFLNRESRFSILTEETGYIGKIGKAPGGEGPEWIVDPLDGSLNFLRGIPVSCTSVGLWHGKKPILGAIYDFNRSELFLGIARSAAWMNGRKIRVSEVERERDAVLMTGFPSQADFSRKALMSFADDIRSYKKVRLFGSAALSLAYVACGRADAYFEKNIMLWDVAAGIPIVMGAGGRFSMKGFSGKDPIIVYASNSFLSKRRNLTLEDR